MSKRPEQLPLPGTANESPPSTVESEPSKPATHFLHFVGGSFYTKESFIEEANRLGISRRMPTSKLPEDLASGESRIYIAFGGKHPSEADPNPAAEIIGYFVPTAVEFIAPEGEVFYADLIAPLKLRPDTRILGTVSGEAQRGCGYRQAGGTYLVVDKADSPLVLFAEAAPYMGVHFRGLKRLNPVQVAAIDMGRGLDELIAEVCQNCGVGMYCSPDSHKRAETERRRIDKGALAPKWRLRCPRCAREARTEKLRLTLAKKRAENLPDGGVTSWESNGEDMNWDTGAAKEFAKRIPLN